jgi:hypothetical protein
MARKQRLCPSVVTVTLAVVGLLLVAMIPTAQGDPKPKVLPLDSSPYGNTYGEWSARWWQWLMAIPAAANPNLDPTGANCAVGQVGPVWFLAGTFGTLGNSVTRNCSVPSGKALLLTPLTQLDGAGAFDCEPTAPGLCDLNALRALAAAFADSPIRLEVTVDGHQLQNVGDYRVQSPVFSLTYPQGAVFGFPSGTTTPNLADGYWLLLTPLPTGAHTIIITGVANSGFGGTVTYHLTVLP